VDGTTNFVHSYPNVCISIGLVIDCEAKLGVIFNPVLDMFFRAIKGEGAYLNDDPIKVSGAKSKFLGSNVTLFKILKKKMFLNLFLELSDALVAVEFGSDRTEEFREIVNHNINYLAKEAHG